MSIGLTNLIQIEYLNIEIDKIERNSIIEKMGRKEKILVAQLYTIFVVLRH